MISIIRILVISFALVFSLQTKAQTDNLAHKQDSINQAVMLGYQNKLKAVEKQHIIDSLKRAELEIRINSFKTSNSDKKEELQRQVQKILDNESLRALNQKKRIDSLRQSNKGYPVLGVSNDTLFYIYTKQGASTAKERAINISKKIYTLANNDFIKIDSINSVVSENTIDIVYKETIIMSISEIDALWNNQTMQELANNNIDIIKKSIIFAKEDKSLLKLIIRIGLVLLTLVSVYLIIWLIRKMYNLSLTYIINNKDKFLKDIRHKNYTLLSINQKLKIILFTVKILRWLFVLIILYFAFPLIFSIFPFTRGWADELFSLVWTPFKGILLTILAYLPNLFKIAIIYLIMKYFIRFLKYIFQEIESEKLNISGFYSDWAMPTYNILKFFLYAFMVILIFPLLPGSDSPIFKGISIFIGVLFSLGSSTAIANMVAGIVITYMRPFKIGDRIMIGQISGDVIEKNLLVTRLKTIKNEEVTIPNSTILSGNTTNFSSCTKSEGLIIHSTVTIGYNVAWQEIHKALIDAALKTDLILHEPSPYVLQTSLDDFYVSYQINAYTREANKQALICSHLHQNIQDICAEREIEILSPHYRAERDGNEISIPENYKKKK